MDTRLRGREAEKGERGLAAWSLSLALGIWLGSSLYVYIWLGTVGCVAFLHAANVMKVEVRLPEQLPSASSDESEKNRGRQEAALLSLRGSQIQGVLRSKVSMKTLDRCRWEAERRQSWCRMGDRDAEG